MITKKWFFGKGR